MLCVYFVLKGKELQLIAASSTHENREANLKSAVMWSWLAYTAAIIFALLLIVQGESVSSSSSF
jgi:hypothetical protein